MFTVILSSVGLIVMPSSPDLFPSYVVMHVLALSLQFNSLSGFSVLEKSDMKTDSKHEMLKNLRFMFTTGSEVEVCRGD